MSPEMTIQRLREQLSRVSSPQEAEYLQECIRRQLEISSPSPLRSYMFPLSYNYSRPFPDYQDDEAVPEPQQDEPRTDEQTSVSFFELMLGAGHRKKLTVTERVQHEMEIGELDIYKQDLRKKQRVKEDEPTPRILCPICREPSCPYST